ncbi:MAG: hypothetical protein WBP45_03225 [Daejeonella sp.]
MLSQVWTGQEELKNIYAEETPVPDNTSGEHVISCFGTSGKQLDFGYSHFYKCKDGLYSDKPCYGNGGGTELINFNDKCTGKFSLSGNSPVMIIVSHKQLVVPAFIAGEIIQTLKERGFYDYLSLNLGLLMPDLLIKPATLGKWARFLKGGAVGVEKGGDELVWNYIKATQEVYPGSVLPKSFELITPTNTIWVHPNATEHIAEFIQMKAINYTPEAVRLATQQQLNSLRSAVGEAIKDGIVYDKIIEIGGWELKFSQARQAGQLPALIHAQPIK